ncbi:MAG: ATP-binding protein [Ginsengibacter sp.]
MINIFKAFLDKSILCLIGLLFIITLNVLAQDQKFADSLTKIYHEGKLPDTAKLEILRQLSFNEVSDLNLSLTYAEELIRLARKEGSDKYLFHGYFQKGNKERILGNYPEALDAYLKSADVAEKTKVSERIGSAFGAIADVYAKTGNFSNAMLYYRKAIITLRNSPDSLSLAADILNAGEAFRNNNIFDSALIYFKESGKIFKQLDYPAGQAYAIGNMGMVYASAGEDNLAEKNINEAISVLEASKDYAPICEYLISMCEIYQKNNDNQKALNYAQRSLTLAKQYNLKEQISVAHLKLSGLYEKSSEPYQALNHYKDYVIYRDSIRNIDSVQKMGSLIKNFEVAQKQSEVNLLKRQKNLQRALLFAAVFVLVIILVLAIILFKNNRQKQKAFMLLSKAKAITEDQRDQTNKALEKLKRTQAHLVQSEKMASLGELTAGIAHEIQNPLNFVNNFSEVNTELITELQEENKKGNTDAVNAISEEIFKNEEKISHHGKRADAIVKGMLEHSRSHAPEKKLTDINALTAEYFRLSYHGLRAKDKSFNAEMRTDFDPEAGEINIVPQELGRVILNLVNNAFYAVSSTSKEAPENFSPTVTVSTKKINDQVLISVKDNGTGMSPQVKEKIFQPFFTTKDPGLGTGLGLSISYDIVKAHGGEIKVESEMGVGSEFTIILPIDTD